jgi:hypothetical protein
MERPVGHARPGFGRGLGGFPATVLGTGSRLAFRGWGHGNSRPAALSGLSRPGPGSGALKRVQSVGLKIDQPEKTSRFQKFRF